MDVLGEKAYFSTIRNLQRGAVQKWDWVMLMENL